MAVFNYFLSTVFIQIYNENSIILKILKGAVSIFVETALFFIFNAIILTRLILP
jgi:hypothetical protein